MNFTSSLICTSFVIESLNIHLQPAICASTPTSGSPSYRLGNTNPSKA